MSRLAPPSHPATWSKLSASLRKPRQPDTCQSCGLKAEPTGQGTLQIWRECDERDQPTETIVLLCKLCAEQLIRPHPRLYQREPLNSVIPGAMPHLCLDCVSRQGLRCTHPNLKENGGAGLLIRVGAPTRTFVDGSDPETGKRRGWVIESYEPASECAGREVNSSTP